MTFLAELIAPVNAILLDFDGPVCDFFAGYPAPAVAAELRTIAAQHGHQLTATGPHSLFQEVGRLGDPALTRLVGDALRDLEMVAVDTATPTTGSAELLRVAYETGRRISIVSNNSGDAIEKYLFAHDLIRYVDGIIGRQYDHSLMKPDPFLLRAGLTALHTTADEAVMVGDSTTDIEAGRRAKVATIGYANKPGKRERLTAAGANAIIDALDELTDVLF
jgi:phosphoglycolate phosphatase-like HAD superfamily hydrolase